MSEKNKIEIEELLNALVDDEATERQKNEFDRLLRHDPSIAEQLAVMQRQRQILGALPVDSAPVSLVEDVLSGLERKQSPGDAAGTGATVTNTAHLFLRRVLTTAAMLLLPIGILSFVVYEIIKPPSVGPIDYSSVGNGLARNNGADATALNPLVTAQSLPFDGVLTFSTQQPMTVSNYAEKMIYDKGLISVTALNRTLDEVTYEITAPPEKIADLIDSLKSVWPRCQQVALSVIDNEQNSHVDVPNVQAEQARTLAIEDSREMLKRLADQYASANIKKENVFAKDDRPVDSEIDLVDSPPLTIPILTGRNEPAVNTIDPSQPTVRLRIQIERVME
ncbi:MAG: anti-sigma factor family protein [Planctomycetota bacterium]|jgi:hypothetical protein